MLKTIEHSRFMVLEVQIILQMMHKLKGKSNKAGKTKQFGFLAIDIS